MKRVDSRVFYKSQRNQTPCVATTPKHKFEQFRYNWKVATIQDKSLRGDVIAKRESWNDFTDMLCKCNEISMNQYNNWTNPF